MTVLATERERAHNKCELTIAIDLCNIFILEIVQMWSEPVACLIYAISLDC